MQTSQSTKLKMVIYRGSTENYPLDITIDGKKVLPADVVKIEIAIGNNLVKTFLPEQAEGAFTHNGEHYELFLSEADTLSLNSQTDTTHQTKAIFKDRNIKFTKEYPLVVKDTLFKEVTDNG